MKILTINENIEVLTKIYKKIKRDSDIYLIECDKKYTEHIGDFMRLSDLYYNYGDFQETVIL